MRLNAEGLQFKNIHKTYNFSFVCFVNFTGSVSWWRLCRTIFFAWCNTLFLSDFLLETILKGALCILN